MKKSDLEKSIKDQLHLWQDSFSGKKENTNFLFEGINEIFSLDGKKRIQHLENEILKFKYLYYSGSFSISDELYDTLENYLKELSPKSEVLNYIGSVHDGEKIKHEKKMLSLSKTYDVDELKSWVKENIVISTFKYDGSSCSLVYEKGLLSIGKTRGDGSFGENITSKMGFIDQVPKKIDIDVSKVEIRGEVFCTEENFSKLSLEMEKRGLDKPTSLRNIVAGILSRKDNVDLAIYLSFAAFELVSDEIRFKTEVEKMDLLKKLNFHLPEYSVHKNIKTLESSIEEAKDFMGEGDFLIDGIVFTYNEISLHEELGETAHHPRYKMAFKFQGVSVPTKIIEILWSVSRNGILTPVANVEPVEISGAVISRVTLHNFGLVKTFGLKEGDTIEIIRSGEVIPKFLSVIESSHNKFKYPHKCPVCDGDVEVIDIRLYCKNPTCSGKIKESILNFIQKMGIDDLSSKRLDQLIEAKIIKSIPDIYKIKKDDLLALEKFQEKLATKLIKNIEKSKNVNLIIFLSSLGISGGAYNKCEKVYEAGFDTLDKIKKLKKEQLMDVDSFAEKSSEEFVKSIQEKMSIIEGLEEVGFKFSKVELKEGPLSGKKICITGELSEKRSVVEKLIRENGGSASSSVTKNLDFLLTNETNSSSSKFKKAKELGIAIISEEEFFLLLK